MSKPVNLALTANILFWMSVFGFAALRPDYSHFTKAVSELGVWGAPNMWAFNVLGYIVPGLLLAACGWIIARSTQPGARIWPAILALSGAGVSIAGIFPANMNAVTSATTVGHLVGSFGSLALWAVSLIWLALAARKTRPVLAISCAAALALTIGAFALYETLPPGLVQRITFAIYFAWFLAAAPLLSRTAA